ncbi:hypothetical protein GY45DRAFT_1307655 [Cubamyces sp. BRFM 1775]|nr:hypothetical protein GY45DRAFT_1307655 [Cubamyces sp. BRFM 1775]
MRPLISYDDIVPAEPAPPSTPKAPMNPPSAAPPAKKRKTNQNQQRHGASGSGRPQQHWDDPGNQEPQMVYDEVAVASGSGSANAGHAGQMAAGAGGEQYEEEEEEESRELTHEEIWDDSALIEAWNSAAAEYEAFHGPGKKWKEQPVKKSPLWYNVPPANTSKSTQNGTGAHTLARTATVEPEADSTPLNFDTFVPSHDPSLAAAGASSAVPAMDGASALGVGAEAATASQDEAFSRAMTAMYWSGYWTAVYHCRRNETQQTGAGALVNGNGENQEDGAEEEADDEDMLPAQR